MTRQHVHLLCDHPDLIQAKRRPTAGIRSSCNVLIYIDGAQAMKDGMPFFISVNSVILTPGPIPSKYFTKVISLGPKDSFEEISLS
jgi:2'-phosphotransferase